MEHYAWRSDNTASEMPVRRCGTEGAALIYVPGSDGDVEEFSRYRMPEACRPWIDSGRVQVFAIDGWARYTLWNDSIQPAERIRAYARYERYVAEELLPWVAEQTNGTLPVIVGCSYGAFVASNLLLKRPTRVAGMCGLGGVYGMWHRLDGYHDDEVYFHTPLEYLPRLHDASILSAIRDTSGFALFAAARDEWLFSTQRMAQVLRSKELPHTIDVWPAPADHHERWWRQQLPVFLSRRFGEP